MAQPRDRCASPALSSVDGSDSGGVAPYVPPQQQAHHVEEIALEAISALRASLSTGAAAAPAAGVPAAGNARDRSPDAPANTFDIIDDDDEDEPRPAVTHTTHTASADVSVEAVTDIDSKTLEAIWSRDANDETRNTPPEAAPAPGDAAMEQLALAFERDDPGTQPFVVAVQALDPRTTTRSLFDTFFPLGCARAVVYDKEDDVISILHTTALHIMATPVDQQGIPPTPFPATTLTRRRIAGLVFFKSEDTARFAAFKMHDFVPHGQSNPLHATFIAGKPFAEAYREYVADPELCAVRAAATQSSAAGSIASGSPSHNTSAVSGGALDTSFSGPGGNRRVMNTVQHLFAGMSPPLISMRKEAAKLALALAEIETAGLRVTAEQVEVVADRFLSECTGADQAAADEALTILTASLTAHHRNLLRVMDAFLRLAAALMSGDSASDAASNCVAVRIQVPVCKKFLHGLLFGLDRSERFGSAAVVASLLDHDLLDGPPFGVCIKLFNSRVLGCPPSASRDLSADAVICLAACIKTAQRNRMLPGQQGSDLLSGGFMFPGPRESRPEGQERDFLTLVHRYREEAAAEPPRTPPQHALSGHMHTPSHSAGASPDASRSGDTPDAHEHSGSSNGEGTPRFGPGSASLTPPVSRSIVASQGGVVGLPAPRYFDPVAMVPPSTLNADILPCTVYITRIPKLLSDARLRTMLTNFGELNKVRVYDNASKRGQSPAEKDDSSFCFVEFRTQNSARSLVAALDRASLHLVGKTWESATWHIVPSGAVPLFDDSEHPLVSSALRCSPARSAIHDHDPRDAVFDSRSRIRECAFGVQANRPSGNSIGQGGTSSHDSSTNGPAGFTTRPMPNRPAGPAVSASSVVASFGQTPSKKGLNIGATSWCPPRDLSHELEPNERAAAHTSSADSSASGFVVTTQRP